MTCPVCARPTPPKADICPHCGAPLVVKRRKWTVADIIEGILFIAFGAFLMVAFAITLIQTIPAAVDLISNFPSYGGYQGLVTAGLQRFPTIVVLLAPLADLLWVLAGLFLLLSGVLSLAAGKGNNQASAAIVLMLIGLVADLSIVIIKYTSHAQQIGFFAKLGEILATDPSRYLYIFQVIVIAATIILVAIKRRAKKKMRFKNESDLAQARVARMQAANVAAAAQTPPAQPPADTNTPPQA